jgi:hypothetical protein
VPGATSFENWSLVAGFVSIAVNAALFVLVWQQLQALREQIKQASDATQMDHVQRRREATLDYVTDTLDRFKDLRKRGFPLLKRADVEAFLAGPPPEGETIVDMVSEYLLDYEVLATGVNLGLLDLEVVVTLRGSRVVRTWEFYKPWIIEEREGGKDRKGSKTPGYFVELEEMARKIQQYRADRKMEPVDLT